MNVITFIRANKNIPIDEVPSTINTFDSSITTKSPYLVYFELFKLYYASLNQKRLTEFLKWINKYMNLLPPVASIEQTMTKIRGELKKSYGFESAQYKASLKYLLFDKKQKEANIAKYDAKIAHENRNTEDLPISIINTLFVDNKEAGTYQQMLTYLLLNSGSRFDEINNGVFSAGAPGYVKLSNISKTLDKKREIEKELLDQDTEYFLSILKKYRALNKPSESAIIQLNTYLKDKYGFTSYYLRKFYAVVSYMLRENKNITLNAWISNVLGHTSDQVARIYSSFMVIEDEPPTFR